MSTRTSSPRRLLAAAAGGCVALALAAQLPASAATGPGTHTQITSPANGAAFLSHVGHEGHLTVKGKTSADVSTVNVYCLNGSGATASAITVATAVPVTSGSFSSTVPVPGAVPGPQCRLRALPDGVNPQAAYVSSYAGPVVNFDSWQSGALDFQLTASAGTTAVTASSVGSCSIDNIGTVAADQTIPGGSSGCLLGLGTNPAGSGAAVVVDGHPAIPPADADRFALTPGSTVHATFHLTRNGSVRWTDTEGLDRCRTSEAFPPPSSCALKATGVEIRQVLTLLKSGQVRVRAQFRSVDGRRHKIHVAYTSVISPLVEGALGLRFPGQKGFHAATAGRKVTHLGHGAGTMFARTNRFGDEGDPSVATRALSWSRTPSRIAFAPASSTAFELDYRLTVPKRGSADLGFGDSIAVRTTRALSLGAKAERDMMPAPRITAPTAGSTVKGTKTKVTGVVTSGANGLPASVTVNGHAAKLKPNKGGSKATYTVTFSEAPGKHTITAVARDGFGNKRSTSVKVRNT
jgi:hypothetical protein